MNGLLEALYCLNEVPEAKAVMNAVKPNVSGIGPVSDSGCNTLRMQEPLRMVTVFYITIPASRLEKEAEGRRRENGNI